MDTVKFFVFVVLNSVAKSFKFEHMCFAVVLCVIAIIASMFIYAAQKNFIERHTNIQTKNANLREKSQITLDFLYFEKKSEI